MDGRTTDAGSMGILYSIGSGELKIEKEGKINLNTLVLFSVLHLVVLMLYTKLKDSG